MSKFYGNIGYGVQIEETDSLGNGNGIWKTNIIERHYCGDILSQTRRLEDSGNVNDDINITNRFSIIADPYAYENLLNMKYICWKGNKWKIKSFEISYPRVILNIGGLYNG